MISARKATHLDVTTMFTYSHANTPLNQSERAYYFSYFIKHDTNTIGRFGGDVAVHMQKIHDPEYKVILFLIFKPACSDSQ